MTIDDENEWEKALELEFEESNIRIMFLLQISTMMCV